MNPVRSFGPALWNWDFEHHWIYWVSPLLAGLIASVFYRLVFWNFKSEQQSEEQSLDQKQDKK